MPTPPRTNDVCGHYDRAHYAKGLCHSCYCSKRQKASRAKVVHTEKPEVANHVAKAIIMNNMDVEQAVKEVIAPNLTPGEQADLVDKLNIDEAVQSALELNLVAKGLDEKSKAEFVAQMWKWLLTGDVKRAMTAARLLGRGFIGEKVDDKKPMVLQIEGFKEGVEKMMGTAPKVADAPLPPDASDDEIDEGDGDDGDEETEE